MNLLCTTTKLLSSSSTTLHGWNSCRFNSQQTSQPVHSITDHISPIVYPNNGPWTVSRISRTCHKCKMFSISKPRNFPLKWNWPPSSFLCVSQEVRSRDLAAQEVTDLLLIFLDESLAAIHVFHRLSVGAADSEEPAVVLAGHGATSEYLTGAAPPCVSTKMLGRKLFLRAHSKHTCSSKDATNSCSSTHSCGHSKLTRTCAQVNMLQTRKHAQVNTVVVIQTPRKTCPNYVNTLK